MSIAFLFEHPSWSQSLLAAFATRGVDLMPIHVADLAFDAGADRIQRFDVSETIVADVIAIMRACGADVGGIEYFIDACTGTRCCYDFKPYSNFVANGETMLGFSPAQRYIDFVTGFIEANAR
jgi:hypothetical protein